VKSADGGTPLRGAKLRTVSDIELTSDDNGVVAFYEPGSMDREIYFTVSHPGYELAADPFGNHGKAFTTTEGAVVELVLTKVSGEIAAAVGDLNSRLAQGPVPGAAQCYALRIFDSETKRGVPLVRVDAWGESAWSDSQGIVAFCNPDQLPKAGAAFELSSHGYDSKSVTLDAKAGGRGEVALERRNLAERLYRLTGGGAFSDSVKLGLAVPISKPTINASVLGQDTASVTVYRGKVFWLWQDTDRASYVLGNFRGTAATSALDFDPDVGVDLSYFENADGFSAEMCPDCMGGPAWLDGLFSAPDAGGEERLIGRYTIVSGVGATLESGMVQFNDEQKHFERKLTDFAERENFDAPSSHPFELSHGGDRYAYYANRLRIEAQAEAFFDPDGYERFTPYAAGQSKAQLTADNAPDYAWRAGGTPATTEKLAQDGFGAEQSLDGHLTKLSDGKPLDLVGVTTTYHAYRNRFLLAGQQRFGTTSALGDIWQAEADTPLGPWVYATQLISHDQYTFYNCLYHPEMARGPFAYLEGTYTATYSGAKELTPRYDYNQLLYRIDLSRPELSLPVPVYDLEEGHARLVTKGELRPGAPATSGAFLAFDAPATGALAIAATDASCRSSSRLELTNAPKTAPLFYALPPDSKLPGLIALYEWQHADGRHAYALESAKLPAGFVQGAAPLARVFPNPVPVKLPVADYLPELIADAGPDQCLAAAGATTNVKLDASASLLPGSVKRYLWHVPGAGNCEYVEGPSVSVNLAPGIYRVELELTDESGQISRDALTVSIQ
jgi:hypothetical protein